MARALLAKGNPVLEAALASRHVEGKLEGIAKGKLEGIAKGKLEGMAEGLIAVLTARGLTLGPAEEARVREEGDSATLRRWLTGAATCASIRELLDR